MGCIQDKIGVGTGELVWGGLDRRLYGRISKSGKRLGSGRIWGLVRAGFPQILSPWGKSRV